MAKKKTVKRAPKRAKPAKRAKRPTESRLAQKVAQYVLNCIPSPGVENDWSFGDALMAGATDAAAIPASKDLRESWWHIGDQGPSGSCVGWAMADSVLRWHLVKASRLTPTQLLSVRYVWMASKETDIFVSRPTTFIESDGTSLKAALDVCRNFGVVLNDDLPFASGALYPGATNAFYAIAAQRKIASYFNLGRDLNEWRKWIANNGPILTRLDVDDTWSNATQTGGTLANYLPLTVRGGHAVALVGYTANHFIVRNSWGTTWGDQGFAFASNAYAAAAFTEAYGVTL